MSIPKLPLALPIIPLELRFHQHEIEFLSKKDFTSSGIPIVYYRKDEYDYMFFGKRYISITYHMFFNKNYTNGLNDLFNIDKSLGEHQQTLERVRILFDYQYFIPKFVYFSAHQQEGIWVEWSNCEFNNNRLVVYVALGSHALNKNTYMSIRKFGFENDLFSDFGLHHTPLLIEDSSIPYTRILNKEVFSSKFRRLFLSFYQNHITKYIKQREDKENLYNYAKIIYFK